MKRGTGLFYRVPKQLFTMLNKKDISITAFKLYTVLADRLRISKFKDEYGKYCVFTYEELGKELGFKNNNKAIYTGVKELKNHNLIKCKSKVGTATRYYEV